MGSRMKPCGIPMLSSFLRILFSYVSIHGWMSATRPLKYIWSLFEYFAIMVHMSSNSCSFISISLFLSLRLFSFFILFTVSENFAYNAYNSLASFWDCYLFLLSSYRSFMFLFKSLFFVALCLIRQKINNEKKNSKASEQYVLHFISQEPNGVRRLDKVAND